MKANMSDEELHQELQKLTGQLSVEAGLLIFELIQRYASADAIVKTIYPDYRYGYIDILSTLPTNRRDMSQPLKKH